MRHVGRTTLLFTLLAACAPVSNAVNVVESSQTSSPHQASPSEPVAPAEVLPPTTRPVAPAVVAAQAEPGDCHVEWRTISTAIEAHWAQYQVDVTSIDELVPEMLLESPVGWMLDFDNTGVPTPLPEPAGRCSSYEPGAAPVESSTTPQSDSGLSCNEQLLMTQLAARAVLVYNRETATSQARLVDIGAMPFVLDLYDFDASGSIVAQFDGDCPAAVAADLQAPFDSAAPECYADWLAVNFAAYLHTNLTGESVGSARLVANGFLEQPITTYEIDADGRTTATGVQACPDLNLIDARDDTVRSCTVQQRTIETALEVYLAQSGSTSATFDDLVPDYLREQPVGWDLVPSEIPGDPANVAPIPGGECDI